MLQHPLLKLTPSLLGVVEMPIKCNVTNVLSLNAVYILKSMWQGA